jgi:methylisocitrate lyase
MTTGKKKSVQLRELFYRKGKPVIHVTPPTPSAARILERAGFEYIFVGGDATLANMMGRPGTEVDLSEKLFIGKLFVDSVDLPVLMDADDVGRRGPAYIRRVVKEFIALGLAGLDMDDRLLKEDEGVTTSGAYVREAPIKEVMPMEDMVEKVRVAAEARKELDPDFVIRVRCYAMEFGAFEGEEALQEVSRRGHAYAEAGADVLYIGGPRSIDEIKRVVNVVPVPVTGPYSWLSPEGAAEAGLCEIRYPYELERVMHATGWDYMVDIQNRGLKAIEEFREKYKDSPYAGTGRAPLASATKT